MQFTRQKIDTTKLPAQVVEKWSVRVLDEGFVPMPKKFVRTLTAIFGGTNEVNEIAAILAVVDFKRPNLSRLPSVEYLAFLAGLSVDEFKKAVSRLEEKGFAHGEDLGSALNVSLEGLLRAIEMKAGIPGVTEEHAVGGEAG